MFQFKFRNAAALLLVGGLAPISQAGSRFDQADGLQKAAFALKIINRDLNSIDEKHDNAAVRIEALKVALEKVSLPSALKPEVLEIEGTLFDIERELQRVGQRIAATEETLNIALSKALDAGDFETAADAEAMLQRLAQLEDAAAKAKLVNVELKDEVDKLLEGIDEAAGTPGAA